MLARLKITRTRSLELPGRGAVAHMSLHQNRQCQRANQHERRTTNRSPIYTGGPVVRSVLATEATGAGKTGSTALVRGHIWSVSGRVNAFLHFCCVRPASPQKSAAFQ